MYKSSYLIYSVFFISLSCFSQNYSEDKIYSWYDEQTGIENSSLFRGIEYVEADRMINEKHKFFDSQEFQKGSVTYDGQFYPNVSLQYNIYDDLLLVNLQHGQRNSFFQLIGEKVNYFQINDYKFKYLRAENNSDIIGFYEVINEEGEFKIYKKHLKNRMQLRDKSIAYSEFTSANPDYIFHFKNDFFDLDNQRDLFSKFPDLKSEIRNFYSDNRRESRDNPDVFMKKLGDEMNDLILDTANEI